MSAPASSKIRIPGLQEQAYPRRVSISPPSVRIYADNAATSVPCPEVLQEYVNTSLSAFGNPSSLHIAGRMGHEALEWARVTTAEYMAVPPSTVYFTSCGTESNNIAIRGVMCKMKAIGRPMIVTSAVEHSSVRRTAEKVAGPGNHIMVPVDGRGYINAEEFKQILKSNADKIGMVSIILAQNEVGTLQSLPKLVRICRQILGAEIPFHTDATQAFGKYYIEPETLGVDLMTASAHKYHGPRGVGILYAKPNILDPEMIPYTGGGQERGCRSGTENVPAIVAATVALDRMLGDADLYRERKSRVRAMRDMLVSKLMSRIPGTTVNGDPVRGIYNLVSISLPGGKGAEIVTRLSTYGICVGSGSACSKGRPSEGMLAMGKTTDQIRGTLRISLSEYNTVGEMQQLADAIEQAWKVLTRRP